MSSAGTESIAISTHTVWCWTFQWAWRLRSAFLRNNEELSREDLDVPVSHSHLDGALVDGLEPPVPLGSVNVNNL